MISDEIVGGLKNALERGVPLQQAKQSFINSGYSPRDVEAAAQQLTSGASTILPEQNVTSTPIQPLKINQFNNYSSQDIPVSSSPMFSKPEKKQAGKGTVAVIFILLILILVLGGLYFFGEPLLAKLFS